MPYVFTNPPKDTELFTCDKVFVLSQTPVKISRSSKDDSKDLQVYTTLRMRKKTAEDVLNMVSGLREEVQHFDKDAKQMQIQLDGISKDLNERFQVTMSVVSRFAENMDYNLVESRDAPIGNPSIPSSPSRINH
jgi:hypothetical protein